MDQGKRLRFSVVVPAYNRGRWVAQAVESALGQARDDVEVIVVDDGSTDDTPAALARYADRAVVLRQENSGVSVARNRGIKEARGEWIAFLDADDRFRPGHLDQLDRAASAHPNAGLIFTDVMVIDEAGRELKVKRSPAPGPDPFVSLLLANTVTTSSAAVRRACFERAGLFLPGLRSAQDWDVWLRVAHYFPVIHLAEVTSDYRRQPGGTVHTRGLAMRDDNLLVLDRAAALRPGLPAQVLARARATCFLESGVRMLAAGDAGPARAELAAAIRHYPALPRAWALYALALGGGPAARAAMGIKRKMERR